MAGCTLRLDTRRATKDGRFPIQIVVGNGTDLYLTTGIYAKQEEWNATAKTYVGDKAKRVNAVLAAELTRVQHRVLELRELGKFAGIGKARLRTLLTAPDLDDVCKEEEEQEDNSLGTVYARVLATKAGRTREIYETTLPKLAAYCDPDKTSLEELTPLWLKGFDASMSDCSVNTRAIHLRNLRNVVNYAIDEGITAVYGFRRFKIRAEETAMRDLPIEATRRLRSLVVCPRLAEYRDIYMLILNLIGINLADLSALTADSIVNGRLEYRRKKTGKLYSILLTDEAKAIIDRYKGERLLLQPFERHVSYLNYVKHLTKGLRDMLPDYPDISPYWARYSWATYAAALDIPTDVISEALGHSHGSRVTAGYIHRDRDKVDEANATVMRYIYE